MSIASVRMHTAQSSNASNNFQDSLLISKPESNPESNPNAASKPRSFSIGAPLSFTKHTRHRTMEARNMPSPATRPTSKGCLANPSLPSSTRPASMRMGESRLAVIIPPGFNASNRLRGNASNIHAPKTMVDGGSSAAQQPSTRILTPPSHASGPVTPTSNRPPNTDSSATVVEKGWLAEVLGEMHSIPSSMYNDVAEIRPPHSISGSSAGVPTSTAEATEAINVPDDSLQHLSEDSPSSLVYHTLYGDAEDASTPVKDTLNVITAKTATNTCASTLQPHPLAPTPHPLPQESLSNTPIANTLPTGRKYIGDWALGKTIGEGSSGKVKLAENTITGEKCVVKAVRRPKLSSGETVTEVDLGTLGSEALAKIYKRELYMIREAALGAMLDHPNIVRLHSAVLGENHFYCFFEHIEGEDLVDYITRCGRIKENNARSIFCQVLSAIDYAHRNHVVHRDIKLENIRYNEKTGSVKLLDFGFATFHTTTDMLLTNCGSPCYAAPEIYDNKPYHGPEVDVWSLGVCLYGMITGSLPFDGPTFRLLASRVRGGKITFPNYVSDSAENLISLMLMVVPRRRATLDEVIRHPWVNHGHRTRSTILLGGISRESAPVVHKDLVDRVLAATVCDAGCHLMNVLKQKIPQRQQKIEEEWRQNSIRSKSNNITSISENPIESNQCAPNKDKTTRHDHNDVSPGKSSAGTFSNRDFSTTEIDKELNDEVHDKTKFWWRRIWRGFGQPTQKQPTKLRFLEPSLEPICVEAGSQPPIALEAVVPNHHRSRTVDIPNTQPNELGDIHTLNESIGTRPLLTRIFRRRVATTSVFTDQSTCSTIPDRLPAMRPAYKPMHGRAYTQTEGSANAFIPRCIAEESSLNIPRMNSFTDAAADTTEALLNAGIPPLENGEIPLPNPHKVNGSAQRTWFPRFRMKRR
ncbi:hypothetical protein BASA83_006224 [Batrachochytrium salamandrivorans]|nr:hypothetical protein BASA83_006224 [Batrachochytrium salamandrivorans]